MPVAFAEPVPELVTEIVPELTIVLEELPETLMPLVFDVIAPLLTTVVGVGPVTVMPVLAPPATVPLLTMVVVGRGAVGLLTTTGPDMVPLGTVKVMPGIVIVGDAL